MTPVLEQIARTLDDARAGRLGVEDAIGQLAAAAEHRDGAVGRRRDGAFFTAPDVAAWIARRAICELLLVRTGTSPERVATWLADGVDLHGEIARAAADPSTLLELRAHLTCLRVLDPTCGAGSFLLAAWRELLAIERLLDAAAARDTVSSEPAAPIVSRRVDRIGLHQLAGIDADPGAVAACRAVLDLAGGAPQIGEVRAADIVHGDALELLLQRDHRADVVIGNPPYVRRPAADAPDGSCTGRAGNLAAWVAELAVRHAVVPGGVVTFVLPVAVACSPAWAQLRGVWSSACEQARASHFDCIPSTLFDGVVQRLTILEGRTRPAGIPRVDESECAWWTTRYHRWRRDERAGLLGHVRFVRRPHEAPASSIAKIGTPMERDLLDLVRLQPPAGRYVVGRGGGVRPVAADHAVPNRFHYKRRWSYFLLFTDFVPPIWDVSTGQERMPTEFHPVDVVPQVPAHALLAVFSSTLFWWWFSAFTDNRNVNRGELAAFPVPDLAPPLADELALLGRELTAALRACAEVRTCTYRSIGTVRNTYFRQAATRPVLDQIDAVLARAYGMSRAQLDFVLGFERGFRGVSPAAR